MHLTHNLYFLGENYALMRNIGVKEWARNVPADPLLQNLSDFLVGERKILYLNPLPLPQHLAEGLPAVMQERPDGLVPVYSGTVPVSGVYEKLTVPNCEWYIILRYTRIKLGTFKTRGEGWESFSFCLLSVLFSLHLINQPFLNRQIHRTNSHTRRVLFHILGTDDTPLLFGLWAWIYHTRLL
jgi:hypothetical protein